MEDKTRITKSLKIVIEAKDAYLKELGPNLPEELKEFAVKSFLKGVIAGQQASNEALGIEF